MGMMERSAIGEGQMEAVGDTEMVLLVVSRGVGCW